MTGWVFPGDAWKDRTPLDYITDKATGKRPNMVAVPSGAIVHDLRPGTGGVVIPSLAIWAAGKYFPNLKTEARDALADKIKKDDQYDSYIVTGEFSPGNYIARIYVLPRVIAHDPEPPHPSLWSEFLQRGTASTYYHGGETYGKGNNGLGSGSWHGYGTETKARTTTPAKPAVPPPPPKQVVPAKVRIRCGGCGHWFKMDDLGSHAEFCCPGINGPESDWAMQCECCDELDQVQTLKAGFPRPKKKVVKKVAKPAPKTTTEEAPTA